jgi:hypothetical protein
MRNPVGALLFLLMFFALVYLVMDTAREGRRTLDARQMLRQMFIRIDALLMALAEDGVWNSALKSRIRDIVRKKEEDSHE